MAESSSEKTEQPTPKRLREAREQGDIAKSQEIVAAATVLVVIIYFISSASDIYTRILAVTAAVFDKAVTLPYNDALMQLGPLLVNELIVITMPLVVCVIAVDLVVLLAQTGFNFAPKAAIPKIENLSPKKWFKQVFSKKNLFDFVMNIVKVSVLCVAVYLALSKSIRAIMAVGQNDIFTLINLSSVLLKDLCIYTITAFIVIAVFDFLFVRFKYIKDHMMTMDEVKREYKEMEGDPHIKSKRKQLHMEMINQSKLDKMRKAKVLIVNPTHYAVAVDYDREKTKLPLILAKGEGDLALRMIEVAKQENIPIMREAPLARALYAQGNEDEFVPSDLLLQVAEVLKVIMSLDKQ